MTGFELDPRLGADTIPIARLGLCRALLMDDARWPWAILVPERPGIVELFDLPPPERAVLAEEASRVGEALKAETGAFKINLGALGNVVRQFHFHLVARNDDDAGWPGPVWGLPGRIRYAPEDGEDLARRLAARIARP